VPGSRVEYAPGGGPGKRCYRINFDKIHRLVPGFKPQWTAREGARELYEAYRAEGLTREDVESSRYIRVKHLQHLLQGGLLDASLRWRNQ
jgi:hypothetical protein